MIDFKPVWRQIVAAISTLPAAFLMLLLLASLPPPAGAVVLCYQEDLDLVQRVMEQDCQGVVVSPEDAKAIEERRQTRLRQGFAGSGWRPDKDLRLAGVGSGFAVSAQGHLVTNHHVVDKCKVISALSPQSEEAQLSLLNSAASVDLALLRPTSGTLARRPVLFASPRALTSTGVVTGTVGEPNAGAVSFWGYPNQGRSPLVPFEGRGQLWQMMSNILDVPVIAFRGNIRQGNSGGPLLNSDDRVIGMVFGEVSPTALHKIAAKTDTETIVDIAFALPHWEILLLLEQTGVAYQAAPRADEGPPRSDEFMVRINCWR